jgi:Peptide N-acetyl-beta-D-glucosaminyl asparaginase amidase A.
MSRNCNESENAMPACRNFRLPQALLILLLILSALVAFAAEPEQFGTDHDDPRTAYPPVPRPPTPACRVDIVDHGFDSFEPARGTIDAAKTCPGPWQRIVLEMDGQVKGRQYDRIGHLEVGGVTVFRTSSPEPSREGIAWHVEKDLGDYAALFQREQPLQMHLGNVVDETYTGIFRIKARIAFYRADAARSAVAAADIVAPLDGSHQDGPDTVGAFTLPANAERLVAEVYATGSGGGCEEFWYFATPVDGYWCQSAQGPYREVQVLVDGRVAGIAAPYPHIYTGGWSNPFLWYAIPAPRAFDIRPIRFELTPFIGAINDGKPHELRLRVLGVPEGSKGWALHPNVQVWRDSGGAQTRGKLLEARLDPLDLANPVTLDGGGNGTLAARARHAFTARGVLQTSRGRIDTTVARVLDASNQHRWSKQEDGDDHLRAEWSDLETITLRTGSRAPQVNKQTLRFGLDGGISTSKADGKPRLTTTLIIHDDADRRRGEGTAVAAWSETRDRFDGSAAYTAGVPREQRRATAHSRQQYQQRDHSGACYRRAISSRNGRFAADAVGCGDGPDPQPARD